MQPTAPFRPYNPPGVYINRQSLRVYADYLHNQSNGLGLIQVLIGILCILFNAIAIAFSDNVAVVSHGFWNGLLFIITGAFGIHAGRSKTKCPIVTFMVLCIVSAVMCTSLLAVGIIGAEIMFSNYSYCKNYSFYNSPCSEVVIAMEAMLATLAIIEAVVAIWGSAICCRSVCCCSRSPENVYLPPPQYVYPDQQQMMMFSQQQQMQMGGGHAYYQAPIQAYQPGMEHCANWSAVNQGYTGPSMAVWNQPPPSMALNANQPEMNPPPYDVNIPSAPTIVDITVVEQKVSDAEPAKY